MMTAGISKKRSPPLVVQRSNRPWYDRYMTAIATFDLDSLPATEFDRDLEAARKLKKSKGWRRYVPRRWLSMSRRSGQGVKVASLYDWRDLEARTLKMKRISDDANRAYWGFVRSLKSLTTESTKHVWIPDEDNEYVTTIDFSYNRDAGVGSTSFKNLVEGGCKDPNYKGVLVTREIANTYRRLDKRRQTAQSRLWVFGGAFHLAVEARLRGYIYSALSVEDRGYTYYKPAVFVIENCGRNYVITSDMHGKIEWASPDTAIYVPRTV